MCNKDFHLEIDEIIHFIYNFEISNFLDTEYLEHFILPYVSTCKRAISAKFQRIKAIKLTFNKASECITKVAFLKACEARILLFAETGA